MFDDKVFEIFKFFKIIFCLFDTRAHYCSTNLLWERSAMEAKYFLLLQAVYRK